MILGVIGAPTLVPRVAQKAKEHTPSVIVPDDTELTHEPSMRKWMNYASPDGLIICQERVTAESSKMVIPLLTGIHALHCAIGQTKVVVLAGVWPDPEFWTLVNVGQVMAKEGKIRFGWLMRDMKRPSLEQWAQDTVLSICELVSSEAPDQESAQGQKQEGQVRNQVVPE